jgi:hypothetical protein
MASPAAQAQPRSRLEPFFLHVGSFLSVIAYFAILESASSREAGVRTALPVAFGVAAIYMLIAHRMGLLKYFDFGLGPMFGLGTLAVLGGSESAAFLFANYSTAILFGTLAAVAIVPPLLGLDPFTMQFARRSTPAWQQKTRDFVIINRVVCAWFGLIFVAAAVLAAWAPHDVLLGIVVPNVLVFVVGLPSQRWIPPLYLRLVGPSPPETVETAIHGMALGFDPRAAGDAKATFQFRVSGVEAGDYWIRVAGGSCESSEGVAASPDLTILTPGEVWLRIARGELEPGQALMDQRYAIEGDGELLLRLGEWFPTRR